MNGSEPSEEVRPPRSVQDLLRYAVEAGQVGAESSSAAEPLPTSLDPEKKKFLEEAIKSLTVDVAQELLKAIDVLKTIRDDENNPSKFEDALDLIADFVDNIDAANDYVKLGGFEVVLRCLSSRHSGVRWKMADVIAQCTQNNPFCQESALAHNLLPPLLKMSMGESDDTCRTKSFFAVSNIVRGSVTAFNQFVKAGGWPVVKSCMESNIDRLKHKSTFFFRSMVSENPSAVDQVIQMGFVDTLIRLTLQVHGPVHEHIVSSLHYLLKANSGAVATCKSNRELEPHLKNILKEYGSEDACREEIEDVRGILKIIS